MAVASGGQERWVRSRLMGGGCLLNLLWPWEQELNLGK